MAYFLLYGGSPDSFSLPSTSTQSPLVPLDLP
jgi:hypothetical protein